MSVTLPSKREFLSKHTNPKTSKPFATFPGRGRFSAEAEAFAAANADKFSDEAPKPTPKPRAAKPTTEVETVEDTRQRAEAPTPLLMPRRKQKVAWVLDPKVGGGNTAVAITRCADVSKGGCGKPVAFCTHATPLAPHYLPDGIALTPMLLDKPLV
jgi:hypothetical protein